MYVVYQVNWGDTAMQCSAVQANELRVALHTWSGSGALYDFLAEEAAIACISGTRDGFTVENISLSLSVRIPRSNMSRLAS